MVDDNEEEVQQTEPETTPAPEPEPKIFGNDPVPVGPVDVDLGNEEAAPAPVAEGTAAPPQQKKEERKQDRGHARTTPSQRIGQMRAQLGAAEQALADRDARLAELERQNRELAARSQHVDAAAFDAHSAQWANEDISAEQALATAHEKQDPALIAAATKRIAKAASELQAINAYKAQFPDQFNPDGTRRQAQARQQEQPRPQPRQQTQASQIAPPPDMQVWLEENPWVHPNSPDFDPDMADAAAKIASVLDARYNRAGKNDQIGTTPYFREMDQMIQQEFPDAYQAEAAPPPQTRRPTMTRPNGAGVAPASRQAPMAAPGQAGSNTVRMTAEEHDFALKMIKNGAYRYPAGHPKEHQTVKSEEDGLRIHAQKILEDRAMEPMRAKR